MSIYSGLLYAPPSFLTGMASAWDIGGTLQQYNESNSPEQADYLATLSDIQALREDLSAVREKLKRQDAIERQA